MSRRFAEGFRRFAEAAYIRRRVTGGSHNPCNSNRLDQGNPPKTCFVARMTISTRKSQVPGFGRPFPRSEGVSRDPDGLRRAFGAKSTCNLDQSFSQCRQHPCQRNWPAVAGPALSVQAHKERTTRKRCPCQHDLQVFIPLIIFDRNSQIGFHKSMIVKELAKVSRAQMSG